MSAVGASRYIEGRVPGGFRFGPRVTRHRSVTRPPSDPPAILAVLAKAEELPSRHTPPGLLLRGVARLLAGRIDQSISLLSLAAAAQPTAEAWTALSAAYLEAATADAGSATELLMRSLDAAEQAIALDARPAEAWFNRALAATQLPPCATAPLAWDEYSTRETDVEWRKQGSRYRDDLTSTCPDAQALQRIPGHARDRIEHELLPGWASAWTAGRGAEADRILSVAVRTADAVVAATGDVFPAHLVREVSSAGAAARDRLAATWTQYARSRELFEQSDDADAAAAVGGARQSHREQDSPFGLLIELHFATMALQLRQLDVALTSTRRVLTGTRGRPYPGLVARARIVRSIVYTRQGRLSDAVRDGRDSGEVLERMQEPELAAAAHGSVATAMRALNDPRGTWAALARTLNLINRVRNVRRRYVVLYNASLVAEGSGMPRAALRYQTGAVEAAERRAVAGTIVEAYTRRAELREHLRRGSGADDLATARRRSLEVSDAFRQRYYSAMIDSVEADSLLEPSPEAARERFGRALAFYATYDATAMPRLHLGRGRASRRLGDVEGARHDFLAGITAFEAGRLRVGVENRVAYFDAARELFDEMVELSDPPTAFAFAERGRALTVVEALGGPVETDPARVGAQLPRGTALIQYATLPDRVMIWVVTPDGTGTAIVSESRAGLEQRVLSFLAAIADEQTADVTAQGEELYRLLLQPLRRFFENAQHIVIVGDGPVHQLPFALLRSNGQYLVERFGIVNALSASAFLAAERQPRDGSKARTILAVGNPTYDRTLFGQLRPLPSAEREAGKVAAMYARHTVLTRDEATRTRFIDAASTSGVIHFGGHAVIDADVPERSALLLAMARDQSSMLTAPEIARLRFPHAPIVVLAACSTATGTAYRMEGATSLSRAFLLAGASSVIGSLWDIDDEVSEAFFLRFHQRLATGEAPAAALRGAQVDLLHAGDARLRAPRAWAAFQLMGALSVPSA